MKEIDTRRLDRYLDISCSIGPEIEDIRKRILSGGTTGDRLKDWSLVYGDKETDYRKFFEKARAINKYLSGKEGQMFLVHELWQDGDRREIKTYNSTSDNEYRTIHGSQHDLVIFGVLNQNGLNVIRNPDLNFKSDNLVLDEHEEYAKKTPLILEINSIAKPPVFEIFGYKKYCKETAGTKNYQFSPRLVRELNVSDAAIGLDETKTMHYLKLEGADKNPICDSDPDLLQRHKLVAGDDLVRKEIAGIMDKDLTQSCKVLEMSYGEIVGFFSKNSEK